MAVVGGPVLVTEKVSRVTGGRWAPGTGTWALVVYLSLGFFLGLLTGELMDESDAGASIVLVYVFTVAVWFVGLLLGSIFPEAEKGRYAGGLMLGLWGGFGGALYLATM